MYFDGVMNQKRVRIGVILVSPTVDWILIAKRLDFSVTNNVSEYEAYICGLEALIEMGIKRVEVLGDSKLVISHVNKEWEVKEENSILIWIILRIYRNTLMKWRFFT